MSMMGNVVSMQRHPPGCDCGCQPSPCPPGWSQEAIACWQEIQRFKQFINEILTEMGTPTGAQFAALEARVTALDGGGTGTGPLAAQAPRGSQAPRGPTA